MKREPVTSSPTSRRCLGRTYYYWLQEVETTGRIYSYGPALTNGISQPALRTLKLFLPLLLQR